MARKLGSDEKALWGRVIETVRPLHAVSPLPFRGGVGGGAGSQARRIIDSPHPNPSPKGEGLKKKLPTAQTPNTLDSHWDRRIHKGGIIPDISVDLHETTLSGAYARLDRALDQAIHQKLKVVLLVTGKIRAHDRASGTGRGAIAAVVGDWLAASRHAGSISAVRQAHPRHGGSGALYIVLKR
jgi:DNA-nicking Smr family endonuclease